MKRTLDLEHEIDGFEAPAHTRSFLQVLWQRKAFVILGACLGVALGFLYHTQRATVYQSDAQILLIKNSSQLGQNGQQSLSSSDDFMSTYINVIRSPIILQQAALKRDLKELKTFENTSDAAAFMRANFFVTRDEKSSPGSPNNLMQLAYRGPVAEDCGKILNAILESFDDFLKRYHKDGIDETLKNINKATNALKTDLREKEKAYEIFHKENELWQSANGVNIETQRIVQLEGQRSLLLSDQIRIKDEIKVLEDAIESGNGLEAVTFLRQTSKTEQEKQQQDTKEKIEAPLTLLILRLHELQQQFADEHPEIVTTKARIEKMRSHLESYAPKVSEKDPAKHYLSQMKIRLQNTESQIKSMKASLEEMKVDARKVNNLEIKDRHLVEDIRRTNLLYDMTLKRLLEIDVVKESMPQAGSIESKTLALPGIGHKIAPIWYQDLAAGLMLGLLIGVALGYVADISDKSFRSPEEIRKQLGLPLVGHIPFFKPDPEMTKRRELGESTIDPMLCCYFKPKSLDSEAYRAVRTALFFSTQGQGLKVIQVTSPNKGDGKSLMISNLAVTTAQSGKRVLLIDADCRRPRQHKVFNLSNSVGLTSILNDTAKPENALQETCVPGLSIIASGPIPHNPSELLVQPRFKELLDSLRPDYDYIFVDTPPLLAVTDPCVVAGMVDGLFLAIRLTRKGRPDAERAREILQSLHVKVFGIVVNGVTRLNAGLYSSQAYDYSDTYVDYENEGQEYYYADDDVVNDDEMNKELAKIER